MLSALQRLGETLTTSELQFLEAHASTLMKNFDVVTDDEGQYLFLYFSSTDLLKSVGNLYLYVRARGSQCFECFTEMWNKMQKPFWSEVPVTPWCSSLCCIAL